MERNMNLKNYAMHLAGYSVTEAQSKDATFVAQYTLFNYTHNNKAHTTAKAYTSLFESDLLLHQLEGKSEDTFIATSKAELQVAGDCLAELLQPRKQAFIESKGFTKWEELELSVGDLKQRVNISLEKRGITYKRSGKFYSSTDLLNVSSYTSVDLKNANMSVLLYNFFPEHTQSSLYDLIGLTSKHLRESKQARVKLTSKVLGAEVKVLTDLAIYSWLAALLNGGYFDKQNMKLAAVLTDEVIFEGQVDLSKVLLNHGAIKQYVTYFKPIKLAHKPGVVLEVRSAQTGIIHHVLKGVPKARYGELCEALSHYLKM